MRPAPGRLVGAGLLAMSGAAGFLDVLSYRFLGEVFPSAMTGNVALMGLALGEGHVPAALRNMTAYGSFVAGLVVAALLLRFGRRAALGLAVALEAALLGGFALLWWRQGGPREALVGLASMAMGVQSGIAHRIGLAGVTTTYFTGTTTGIVFGLLAPGTSQTGPAARRVAWPVAAFAAYLGGAAAAGVAGHGATGLPLLLPFAATVLFGLFLLLSR